MRVSGKPSPGTRTFSGCLCRAKRPHERREFDTIYHEHLSYFSLTALDNLFERHGLGIEGVEQIPIHGGSLRVFVSNKGTRPEGDRPPSVARMLQEEKEWGV